MEKVGSRTPKNQAVASTLEHYGFTTSGANSK